MKFRKLIITLGLPLVVAGCGKQDLPYDLDGVTKSFAVSISKASGSDLILNEGVTDGNYKVKLEVPANQGNYKSYFKEAQLLCVYTPKGGAATSKVVSEGIKEFPAELTFDLKTACTAFGITSPSIGDKMELTVNIIHKNGTIVPGWTNLMGFNNKNISYLQMEDGSNYNYRVTYAAFAPFNKDKFQGIGQISEDSDPDNIWELNVSMITEAPDADYMPKDVSEDDLYGIKIEGDIFFTNADALKIWINTKDYSVIIPDQIICPNFTYANYGTYDAKAVDCSGELDTSKDELTFYFDTEWGPYNFGDGSFHLSFANN